MTVKKCSFLKSIVLILSITTFSYILPTYSFAEALDKQILKERQALFEKMESLTLVPWTYLAAMDQFERNIQPNTKTKKDRLIAISVPKSMWAGLLNPDHDDTHPASILFFGGIGRDGNGDGLASSDDDLDVLYSIALYLSQYGVTIDDIRIGLWEYYKRDKTVRIIDGFAKIYSHYKTLDLHKNAFPIPRGYNYTYHNTWGDPRGWGGRRHHEGTDIFAGYGTPVRSTTYGVIEELGWNNYGGWRVGIRDLKNVYHYFAHLSGYNKGIRAGMIVEPGQLIGFVGSSGYGRPGTSGKFAPHLHFGLYKDNGKTEWAFDPYPHLKRWEREDRKKRK